MNLQQSLSSLKEELAKADQVLCTELISVLVICTVLACMADPSLDGGEAHLERAGLCAEGSGDLQAARRADGQHRGLLLRPRHREL